MIIFIGVRLYLLFAGCVSEAKVFSDVLIFDSLTVLDFLRCIFFQITSEVCCFFLTCVPSLSCRSAVDMVVRCGERKNVL